jgi:regulator of replication initiation timing
MKGLRKTWLQIMTYKVNVDVEETGSVSNAVNQGIMLQEIENMIEELKAKLEESQTASKELKKEMVVSRTKSQTKERTLTEELDIMSDINLFTKWFHFCNNVFCLPFRFPHIYLKLS